MMEPVAWAYKFKGKSPVLTDEKKDWAVGSSKWTEEPLVRLSDAEARIKELEAKIDRMNAHGQYRDKRIKAQRRSNRETWEIVEMRAKWMSSKASRDSWIRQIKARKEAEARAEAAEALLEEAGKALEPFARYRTADGVTGMDGNTHLRIQDSHVLMCNMKSMADWAAIDPSTVITVGDFRAARAIHHKIGGKDE